MIDYLFREHPRSVNETYAEHWRVATRFGLLMVRGGLAALVHGLVPALFVRTGSSTVSKLHRGMVRRQPDTAGRTPHTDVHP